MSGVEAGRPECRLVGNRCRAAAPVETAAPPRHLVVLPAYNEEEALPATVASLQALPHGFELLIVDDGSSDRTGEVADGLARTSRLPLHVLHLPLNGGIGVAVQSGYLFADRRGVYRYVFQFDADGQHPVEALPAMAAACVALDLDLCIGSRFVHAGQDTDRSTATRRAGIGFIRWWVRLLSGAWVSDPTSGLRCAGPRVWRRFARHYPEDYPEPETLFWCLRSGLRVGEVPVRMRPRQGGVSSIRFLRTAYYMIKVPVAILLDRLRGPEIKA